MRWKDTSGFQSTEQGKSENLMLLTDHTKLKGSSSGRCQVSACNMQLSKENTDDRDKGQGKTPPPVSCIYMPLAAWESHLGIFYGTYIFHSKNWAGAMFYPYRKVKSHSPIYVD